MPDHDIYKESQQKTKLFETASANQIANSKPPAANQTMDLRYTQDETNHHLIPNSNNMDQLFRHYADPVPQNANKSENSDRSMLASDKEKDTPKKKNNPFYVHCVRLYFSDKFLCMPAYMQDTLKRIVTESDIYSIPDAECILQCFYSGEEWEKSRNPTY